MEEVKEMERLGGRKAVPRFRYFQANGYKALFQGTLSPQPPQPLRTRVSSKATDSLTHPLESPKRTIFEIENPLEATVGTR